MENEIMINGVVYVKKSTIPPVLGDLIIVRTYSAGVHVGVINMDDWKKSDEPIMLKNARRIWRWRGVNREQYTRISAKVSAIKLVPIEIMPVASGLDFSEVWND